VSPLRGFPDICIRFPGATALATLTGHVWTTWDLLEKTEPIHQMRFRKLRIAWSVAWGIACEVSLVAWIGSYFKDFWMVWGSQRFFFFDGVVAYGRFGRTAPKAQQLLLSLPVSRNHSSR